MLLNINIFNFYLVNLGYIKVIRQRKDWNLGINENVKGSILVLRVVISKTPERTMQYLADLRKILFDAIAHLVLSVYANSNKYISIYYNPTRGLLFRRQSVF